MPGLGNSKNDYKALADLLTKEGLTVVIAGVNRVDWLRNAAGVVDINYWKGTLNPKPTVNWYVTSSLIQSAMSHWTPKGLFLIILGSNGFSMMLLLPDTAFCSACNQAAARVSCMACVFR